MSVHAISGKKNSERVPENKFFGFNDNKPRVY